MLSFRGRCHTWDRHADGYCRGEACGTALLREQDSSGCTVLGVAVRQDGRSASLTAPNGSSQRRLLAVVSRAERTRILEAHGTGTALGDPIEAGAVVGILPNPVVATSVKATAGHLEACAAFVGLVALRVSGLEAGLAATNSQLRCLNAHLVSLVGALELPKDSVAVLMRPMGRLSSFGYSGTISHAAFKAHSVLESQYQSRSCSLF